MLSLEQIINAVHEAVSEYNGKIGSIELATQVSDTVIKRPNITFQQIVREAKELNILDSIYGLPEYEVQKESNGIDYEGHFAYAVKRASINQWLMACFKLVQETQFKHAKTQEKEKIPF